MHIRGEILDSCCFICVRRRAGMHSRLRRIQNVFSILVIALGAGQFFATALLFPRVDEPAAWFAAGGLALALVGTLSRLQLTYSDVAPGLLTASAVAASVAAVFWLALAVGLSYKFRRHPAAYGAAAIVVIHAAVAVYAKVGQRTGKPADID